MFGLAAMLVAALASAIPAKGQPWIGSGGRRRRGEPATPQTAPAPPSGTIEPAPAGIGVATADARPGAE
jgi:hypothetical protein